MSTDSRIRHRRMAIAFELSLLLAMLAVLVLCIPPIVHRVQTASPAAAHPVALETAAIPALLRTVTGADGVRVEQQFQTGMAGVTGYVVAKGEQKTVVFSMQDHLLIGALIAANGDNLTQHFIDQYIPKPEFGAVVHELASSKGRWITEGAESAPAELIAFVDPDCRYCDLFWHEAQPLIAKGQLRVRFAPVSFLKGSSIGRAVGMLAAADPAAALDQNFRDFDAAHEEGGYQETAAPAPELTEAVQANWALVRKIGGAGTPTLLYHDLKDRWVVHYADPGAAWLQQYAQTGHAP